MKKLLIGLMVVAMASAASADVILGWSFAGSASIVSQVANDVLDTRLVSGGIYNDLTRGAGAGTSAGASSFRTAGFMNNGIATANTDYFQFVLSPVALQILSLNNIVGTFAGTATYSTSPGVSHQWGYRLGAAGDFTLIATPQTRIGNGSSSFDFTGTTALQNVESGTDVYLRYYATGQTSTGGWGFGSVGFDLDGTLIPEPGVLALMAIGGLFIVRFARRRR